MILSSWTVTLKPNANLGNRCSSSVWAYGSLLVLIFNSTNSDDLIFLCISYPSLRLSQLACFIFPLYFIFYFLWKWRTCLPWLARQGSVLGNTCSLLPMFSLPTPIYSRSRLLAYNLSPWFKSSKGPASPTLLAARFILSSSQFWQRAYVLKCLMENVYVSVSDLDFHWYNLCLHAIWD